MSLFPVLIGSLLLAVMIVFLQHVDFLIHLNKAPVQKLVIHFILYRVINESDTVDLGIWMTFIFKLIMAVLQVGVDRLIWHLVMALLISIWFQNLFNIFCSSNQAFLVISLFSYVPIDMCFKFLMVLYRRLVCYILAIIDL